MKQKADTSNSKPARRSDNGLILPWFLSTRNFVSLWILVAVLLLSGIAVMFLRVPIYSAGVGVVDWQGKADATGHGPVVVAFFPASMVSQLVPGRPLSFQLESSRYRLERPIIEVKARPLDRAAVVREFAVGPHTKTFLPDQAAVAIVELGPLPKEVSPDFIDERVIRARYLLSKHRVGSFFPFIGRFFAD